ncbi:MAG: Hpt domain-containing protein [Rhodospirillales bacterium]|nr:Hpt domain-containing protein [Rhodospirillales bacterium]
MSDDDLEFITPPNTLKAKVSIGGVGAVDESVIQRAEEAIAGMTDDYLEWVYQDISRIELACKELKGSQEDRGEKLRAVFHVAHDIKGQGGSFGFDLMTTIGNQMCRLIDKADVDDPHLIEVIDVHVDAMKLIIAARLKGDGGRDGELMLAGLQKVCEKILG